MKVIDNAVTLGFASWFLASVISQHPDRSFEKVRLMDPSGSGVMIPNWRFFAPNPAVEDQHFLYRLADANKEQHTEWRQAYRVEKRKLMHAFWFPGRREEKAIFDVASSLLQNRAAAVPIGESAAAAGQKLVVDFVRHRLSPEPGFPYFQVLLVRYAGYDHTEQPIYDMIFDYEKVELP